MRVTAINQFFDLESSENSCFTVLFLLCMHQILFLHVRIYNSSVSYFYKVLNEAKFNIIIISSCHQYGYLWPFLTTSPYRSLLSAGPQGYTPYPHRAALCRFDLVILLLPVHVKGFIGVHHLWACPYFSNSILHVWFI